MIKESNIMTEIHKTRKRFYEKTKNMSRGELLKLINDQGKRIKEELSEISPAPKLIIKKKYKVPESEAMTEIHQIREQRAKYGKV
ncbi:MAG: hypothetical protein A2W75_00665 [Nitrospinae bacterium RIFCSPLOWO2_12_39_15]|nr:MAG: hypothetical protein A2W53_07430 [Nitrospinae bacterium RIFCSPHIGHO2_02_39_11]OGW10981.1 MAG: hypothetical protein A2W75_00665 [Nitrospinae bacterium RIFCSPLOWO2_12_39_15]